MVCKLRRYENEEVVTYSCYQVRDLKNAWLAGFRKQNKSDMFSRNGKDDPAFVRYLESINEFLENCQCEADLQEEVVPALNKRPVGELIAEAKERRERGESPWKDKIHKNI